ncbi:GntR family transcriptional regulator [Photobacterium profundum]|uniref:Putative transcriptional regulator, GntR family protein n=1 Tax=Photobacterium profundum 3TCK TaxID=314280 RepID=Q1YZQ6_9GAMM|nr:GntR family transcriptional regulator [Photobacterium profundum]EAS41819.1 putative transcriptional regulator, GntR family protein [Photobacterium profundum 3TCK]PSV61641.1 GntR family transcriptional regulator [Photobacterium profundum]
MTSLSKAVQKKSKTKSPNQTQDDVVYCHIFDAILEQRLPPGTKLNEEALSEIFSVSRTIIRRALLRLSLEQVVVIRPNRGAIVAAPTIEEAKQIFKAREVMELAITELAVENATQEQIKQIRKLVTAELSAFEKGDFGSGIRLSGEFHLKLAEMANNAPLLNFQRSLVSQTSLLIAQYEVGNNANCSLDEHTILLDAIEAGDKEKALSLMTEHLNHIRSKLSLDGETASNDLHVVFSNVIKSNALNKA